MFYMPALGFSSTDVAKTDLPGIARTHQIYRKHLAKQVFVIDDNLLTAVMKSFKKENHSFNACRSLFPRVASRDSKKDILLLTHLWLTKMNDD